MPKLTTVYWRDIPAQVIVRGGRAGSGRGARGGRAARVAGAGAVAGSSAAAGSKVILAGRFAEAIDRAAMRAGRGSSDKYLEDWRRETVSASGSDLDALAQQRAAELEAAYDDVRLEALVKAGGVDAQAEQGSVSGPGAA